MTSVIQPSFAKGEIAPDMYGRVDTSAYGVALALARNCNINITGGVTGRHGTRFIGPVKTHTDAQVPSLFKFQFKTTDSYILEMGNLYMRVIRNDGHVVETGFAISAITKADPCVITTATHSYVTGAEVLISGIAGMTELNGRRFVITQLSSTTFSIEDQVTGVDIDSTAFTAWSSGGTSEKIFELVTPYAIADVPNIKFTQSADVMTLTHPGYDPRELKRTDHDAWTIPLITFAPTIDDPITLAVSSDGVDEGIYWKYKVTAIARETFEESLSAVSSAGLTVISATKANPVVVNITAHGLTTGDDVEITGLTEMTELNGRRFIITEGVDANNFTLDDEDGTVHGTAESTGGANTCRAAFVGTGTAATPDGTKIPEHTITWAAVTDAQKYFVYRAKGGSGSYGFLAETNELTFNDHEDALQLTDLTVTPPTARTPFIKANEKPGAVSFFEQRRVFGGSTNKPDTKWYSKTGNFPNLSVSSPSQADDAITTTLAALEVNDIRHFVPTADLAVFTSGSEWIVNAGGETGFSTDTLKQKIQSFWGCSHNRPIVIGKTIFFVQENLKTVRSFGFSFQADGHLSSDMSQFASHMFDGLTIVDWAYARDKHQGIHVVRSDGTMAVLTFNAEQEVVAWSTWDTLGNYERASSIRANSTDAYESAFFVVKRLDGNGNTVRYIERENAIEFDDIQDAFFVDCGLSLDTPLAITAITLASPGVITSTAHGLSDGETVDIEGIKWVSDFDADSTETQPAQLNGGQFLVANKTNDTFTLTTLAGTAVDTSAFNAYVEGGNAREAVLTVSGLRHLAGLSVDILANGNVVSGITVSATGTATVTNRASRWHIGLKFISDVETLDIVVPAGGGTIQDEQVRVTTLTIKLEKSRGLLIGPSSALLTEMKQRDFEAMGTPTNMLTGEYSQKLPPDWNSNGRVFVRQRNPLPMTILGFIPDLEVGDSTDD